MLSSLIDSIPNGNPKHPFVLYRLINTIEARMKVAVSKFDLIKNTIVRTPGVDLLRYFLLNFDLEEADSYSDLSSMYIQMMENYRIKYRVSFDPIYTKTLSGGRFISGPQKTQTSEILLNSTRANPSSSLFFYEGWESWKNVRGVRILWHDSPELSIDCIPGYMMFTKKRPTTAVISIDIPVLLTKWYVYNKEYEGDKSPEKFILMEYRNFYKDSVDIWFTNLLTTVITKPDATVSEIVDEQVVPNWVTNSGMVEQGVTAIKELTSLLKSRMVKFQDILDTELHPHWISIRKHIKSLESQTYMEETKQYLWLNMIRYLPLMRMMCAMFRLDVGNPLYEQTMRKAYNWYVNNIKYANAPTLQWMQPVKNYVNAVNREFEDIFSDQLRRDAGSTVQADA